MDSIQDELSKYLTEVKSKNTSPTPEVTPEPQKVEEPAPEPKDSDAEEPAPDVAPIVQEKSDEVLSWDKQETEEEVVDVKYDFSKLGVALGLEKVKDEDELVSHISTLTSELKTLKETPLSGIPEDFKEVVEVAKKSGGDWKAYLSQSIIDYSKADPVQLFEEDFYNRAKNNPKYFTDGKLDLAKVDDAFDNLPDVVKETTGYQIQQALVQQQHQRRQEIVRRAQEKAAAAERDLSTAARNLQEILPVENFGIKFEPRHSSLIYEGISNSKLTKKHLGVSFDDLVRSGADMKSIAKTISLAEFGEKMIKFKSQSSKVEAKKELLAKTQNAQIKAPGTAVQPEDKREKSMSAHEKMEFYMKSLNKPFS